MGDRIGETESGEKERQRENVAKENRNEGLEILKWEKDKINEDVEIVRREYKGEATKEG